YFPDVAAAGPAGEAVIGWYSNAAGAVGLFTQTIAASGPVGPKLAVPRSATGGNALAIDQRVAIVARVRGGGYVAYGAGYPTLQSVDLWRHGTAKPVFSIPAAGAQDVNIAAAP